MRCLLGAVRGGLAPLSAARRALRSQGSRNGAGISRIAHMNPEAHALRRSYGQITFASRATPSSMSAKDALTKHSRIVFSPPPAG